ncbi:hypothetical protein, partial [Aeromonas sp. PrichA-15]|uniref:hypothetical protein n=1 Tax=Aeromonas sp. PrichA-15 TaxID=2823360 RepID=UPI001B322EA3
VGIPAECMVFLLMGGAYLRSRIKQAGKWDQETIVSFFLCQYCSGEYLRMAGVMAIYNLHDWIDEQREAYELWDTKLMEAVKSLQDI